MIIQIFSTFDSRHTGLIALEGSNSDETRDAMDLAYTFLRFAGALNNTSNSDRPDSVNQQITNPILVKPGALYRIMGLIGDQWMPDGNNDNFLNADEFFSVIKIYQDIQQLAQRSLWSLYDVPVFTPSLEFNIYDIPGGPYYSRNPFIHNLHSGFRSSVPYMYDALQELGDDSRSSLLHALISVPDSSIHVYPTSFDSSLSLSSPPSQVILRQYVRSDAALGPAAVFSLLDRLMLICNQNEDNLLDWRELDCAMPLVLNAGLQIVSSELIDLDPIVHDGSKLLLKFLNSPGLPMTIAKLVAINGSVREVHLPQAILRRFDQELSADWSDIARFIGAPTGSDSSPEQARLWELETLRRFGHCDENGDGRLSGPELDCFANLIVDQMETILNQVGSQFLSGAAIHSISSAIHESSLIRIAIKLATQPTERLEHFLRSSPEDLPGVTSSPVKLLKIIEESIRRSAPLCQLPEF